MIKAAMPDKTSGEEEQRDITELSEDMVMVSPGAMLCEARKKLSLSQEDIAKKLNFKLSLVADIEADVFDPSMPVTFNRGYLTNYAKLVRVEVEDVLASYDALDAASIQRSEMLSFSKQTAKQAEHSRVMWLSYFIVAVLIGLTILWWQQESRQQGASITSGNLNTASEPLVTEQSKDNEVVDEKVDEKAVAIAEIPVLDSDVKAVEPVLLANTKPEQQVSKPTVSQNNDTTPQAEVSQISTAVFTFNGDCWVNIYDATGERIAWGVKKSGYVMTIQGKAPLRITVGKPELTSIIFNGQPVDMSAFNIGNIAKFTLPITLD